MQNNGTQAFTTSIAKEDVFAGFFTRLAAYLIDSLLLGVFFAIPSLIIGIVGLTYPGNFLTRDLLFSFNLWDILKYLLSTAYFVVLTYLSGMTPGKKVMRIRVVSAKEEKLSFLTVLYRETIGKYLSSILLFIGYILIGIDKEKRGLHDILCDTRVIYTCKVVEYKYLKTIYTPIQNFPNVSPQGFSQVPPQAPFGNGNTPDNGNTL